MSPAQAYELLKTYDDPAQILDRGDDEVIVNSPTGGHSVGWIFYKTPEACRKFIAESQKQERKQQEDLGKYR